MTNISKLRKDLEIVRRALSRDKQGYDADGYNAEGFDRYGRSRERMEQVAREHQTAFESLTPEKQAFVLKAVEIQQQYLEKAIEWENQPQQIKQKSPFYEEYMYHSDITKRAFLMGWFMRANPEHEEMANKAASLMIRARNKLFPVHGGMH